jgi:hypothetical protein
MILIKNLLELNILFVINIYQDLRSEKKKLYKKNFNFISWIIGNTK